MAATAEPYQKLPQQRGDGFLAYRRQPPPPGAPPAALEVLFLNGYMSDMNGIKCAHIRKHCAARGWACTTFDYSGCGSSSGRFTDCTISDWLADTLAVIDEVTSGPLLLVGSSMGAWLMVLATLACPQRCAALVGIAAAPDCTENLVRGTMAEELKATLMAQGIVHVPSAYSPEGYPVTRDLVLDGRKHLVLNGGPIAITAPVHLLHGTADTDVPWTSSHRLLDKLDSKEAALTLIKDGNHRLSTASDLEWVDLALDRMQRLAAASAAP